LADDPKDLAHEDELKKYCKNVKVVLINPKIAKLKTIIYLFTKKPLSVPYFYSTKLQRTVDQLLSTNSFDVIFCFSSPMAEYVFKSKLPVSGFSKLDNTSNQKPPTSTQRLVTINQKQETSNQQLATSNQQPATRIIMDFVDVDSDKWTQYARHAGWPFSWIYRSESRRLAQYERKVAKSFDHSIFVTGVEKRIFENKNPHIKNIIVIPNGVDLEYFSPQFNQKPETSNYQPATRNKQPVLLFTGAMDYFANVDGVVWFTKEILPLIKREIPEAKLFIVGSNPTREVLSLNDHNGVVVTGFVKDIRPFYEIADVSIIPLSLARGIQNKVLEAMAMKVPVVATSRAFEGINAAPHRDLLVEDEPGAFAQAVVRLLRDSSVRNELRNNARRVIEANYSWTLNLSKIDEIIAPTSSNHRPETSNKQRAT
jgi:sugar transferase (PEP-CTERM/EpsH1 system associated)